jgi:hypothetical protein
MDPANVDPEIKEFYDPLPASHLTPLAFKPTPDRPIGVAGGAQTDQAMGFIEYESFPGNPNSGIFPRGRSDGYILRFRNLIPTVQSVTLNPNVAAGGLGTTVNGLVTLGGPAPASGADVTVSLDNTSAASLGGGTGNGSIVVRIAPGATTGTFTIATQPVTTQTAVNVTATYEGAFKVATLNVVPWLQSISVTPNTLVGGNTTTGRVTLSQAAPTGGVTVDLSTDTPSLISYPTGTTITVPAGQTTTTFSIATQGVANRTTANVTASVLGVNRTASLTLNTANLRSLFFNPASLAGLGTTTGVITLDGKAGSSFTVDLSGLPGTYGYPNSINVPAGASEATFTVTTPNETAQVTRTVIASRPASGGYAAGTVSGSFTVEVVQVDRITLSPTVVDSGNTSTATVDLNAPAPLNGATVTIAYDPLRVSVPASIDPDQNGIGTLNIPSGLASASFVVTATIQPSQVSTVISASRSTANTVSATLTIRAGVFGITLNPSSILGGRESATGTVTLGSAAGPGGFTVTLSSPDSGVTINPSTVTIPAGGRTATFQVSTTATDVNRTVTINGTAGTATASAVLTVRANGVAGISVTPSRVRGGRTTTVTVSLEASAGTGGQTVAIDGNRALLPTLPTSVTIPAGQTSVTFTVLTRRVSRAQSVLVTASTPGSSASTSLLITR